MSYLYFHTIPLISTNPVKVSKDIIKDKVVLRWFIKYLMIIELNDYQTVFNLYKHILAYGDEEDLIYYLRFNYEDLFIPFLDLETFDISFSCCKYYIAKHRRDEKVMKRITVLEFKNGRCDIIEHIDKIKPLEITDIRIDNLIPFQSFFIKLLKRVKKDINRLDCGPITLEAIRQDALFLFAYMAKVKLAVKSSSIDKIVDNEASFPLKDIYDQINYLDKYIVIDEEPKELTEKEQIKKYIMRFSGAYPNSMATRHILF